MPVVDWTRTELDFVTPTGATAMRFDHERFAAFDLFVLKRQGAENDYSDEDRERAKSVFEAMPEEEMAEITRIITSALPGSTTEPMTVPGFRETARRL